MDFQTIGKNPLGEKKICNSSKSKQNSPFEFLSIKNKFLPLPSFDRCGQSTGRNQIPQVAGKPTPRALHFDPSNYEF